MGFASNTNVISIQCDKTVWGKRDPTRSRLYWYINDKVYMQKFILGIHLDINRVRYCVDVKLRKDWNPPFTKLMCSGGVSWIWFRSLSLNINEGDVGSKGNADSMQGKDYELYSVSYPYSNLKY